MKNNDYINTTKYAHALIVSYVKFQSKNSKRNVTYSALIVMFTLTGSSLLTNQTYLIVAYILLALGLLVIPIIYFVLLNRSIKIAYKNILEANNQNEPTTKFEFAEDIICSTDNKRDKTIQYKNITNIYEYEKLIILQTKKQGPILLDKNGFSSGKSDDFLTWIREKTHLDKSQE